MRKQIKKRIVLGSLRSKMVLCSADPVIDDALRHITDYAGTLLREESTLSLSYVCVEKAPSFFEVHHKDRAGKHRTVRIRSSDDTMECSCRLLIWRGIVCRHVLCVLRRINRLCCPVEWFHDMWARDYANSAHHAGLLDRNLSLE